jgi:hypothetical protein
LQDSHGVQATAIIGIIVAGVVGPALGYLAGWWSDRSRFRHERTLNATDDLIARIDEVAGNLEALGATCATMRQVVLVVGGDTERVPPVLEPAEDAYQVARASIARLGMRPHSGDELPEAATAASKRMMNAIEIVRAALIDQQSHGHLTPNVRQDIGTLPAVIDDGYGLTRAFQDQARDTLAEITGPPQSVGRLTVLRQLAAYRLRSLKRRGG